MVRVINVSRKVKRTNLLKKYGLLSITSSEYDDTGPETESI